MALERITDIFENTGSFITGSDTSAIYIECFGAGGGGGGASAHGISGGGGAGAYSALFIPSGSMSESGVLSCSVGAGGAGGLGGATRLDTNTGSVGSDTWLEPSASRCLAKGGFGGQGAASPKGGGGGLANLGTGSLKVDGSSGTVGFNYQDRLQHNQAQSGDGGPGFFGGGGGPGVNSKIIGHPPARSGSKFGAGGGGANEGRGGPGSAGLIRVWEYSLRVD